jgi:SAM-dependent methyltransferase
MRSAKVMLLRQLVRDLGLRLKNRRVFDYGFGAGAFFLECPRSARLFGVELDPVAVEETATHLRARGFGEVRLAPLDPARWRENELLHQRYDLVVCSHVLEHIEEPVALLKALAACLEPQGVLLVLLPLNERRRDPHHLHAITPALARGWADQAGLEIRREFTSDHACYWPQPWFATKGVWDRAIAQALSLGLGLAALLVGRDRWMPLGDRLGPFLGAKPTQLALALVLRDDSSR